MNKFSKLHFRDIEEGEEIVKVLHRNWFYVFEQFLWLFVLTAIFFVAIFWAPTFLPEFFGPDSRTLMLFFENFFTLVIWIYGFMLWIDYYFDIWIITTQRIINIEQEGMFARLVSEMEYSKMQDITAEVAGFLPTIINFGDVKVQTAGEDEEFVFRTISDPYQIKNIIFNLRKKDASFHTEELGEMIKEKIEA